ncbi:MTH1187 family thiamine-binding protein [Sporosalibacterium faouarense]|uniref:MTH1187 family thiamine-binding protein n=1 Tax=Sporosalibacterium faouarense TaxID=516123 RepID=UPI00141CF885|nr:MTH1187 family thiamine-binding protein [Sporosalibacterium faouarense]MTI49076.1 MTH1187 family thiamine-binding protein [Bacillota bacterium]
MAIVEVTIVPLGTGDTSVSKYVAKCHEVLKKETEVKHMLTPMGTVLEGDLDKILAAIRKMHEVPFGEGAKRVSTQIKIDDRRDKQSSMTGKMESVESKL